jgi:hypothetical protein
MRRLALVLGTACAMVATAPALAVAQATPIHSTLRSEYESGGTSPCTLEPIFTSFRVVEEFTLVQDPRGGIHGGGIAQVTGKGYGLDSGTSYVLSSATPGHYTVDIDGFPSTTTQISEFHFIGQGSATDFIGKLTYHVTFNANGDPTADVFYTSFECK